MPEDKVINKVVYGGDTLMDITDTTATEADVVSGKDFYLASGKKSSGTLMVPSKTSDLINDSGFITKAIYYGTSSSAAADEIKIVTCSDFGTLETGDAILVRFSTTNSAAVANLKLNVNNTGAVSVKYINNGTLGNLSSAGYLKANTTYLFVYDGTYWVVYLNYNTTYSSMTDAEIEAGTGTTARTITPARLKNAIQTWEHVHSVNGETGDVTLDIPEVPDWALEENPPTYALSYDENSIGSSYTDTAVTIEPNYTPSGDVILESDTVSIPNAVHMTYSYNSYTCTLSINDFILSGTEYNLPTSAKFHGSGVKFVINSNVNSNAVGTGAADYMEI